jgi:hypothetical protein
MNGFNTLKSIIDSFIYLTPLVIQDCCDWHQNATCCKRIVCKAGNKPNAPRVYNAECDSLLGLLNCAPCRNDSGLFMKDPDTTTQPWDDGVITVCTPFCLELYNSCYPVMSSNKFLCAFGDDCKFEREGFVDNYTGGTLDDSIRFCNDFGVLVSDDDCFSLSVQMAPQLVVILFSAVIVFILESSISRMEM